MASSAAHEAGMLPEELLICVKDNWMRELAHSRASESRDVSWMLTEFISLCIGEYYRPQPVADDSTSERPFRRVADVAPRTRATT